MLKTIAAFDRIGEENAFAVLARANALAAQGKDIISLGIGQPDFRTPEFIVEAAIKALRDGHHGYTPATGIPQLREAVAADLHKRFKVEVSPDSVMIMPGGKPTMFMSILMFGEPGADIMYPDPGFPIYRSMIEFTGARPIPVPIREENGFAFSAEETLKLITPQTRLLIVNSPANPTGGVTPKSEIDKLVAGLEKFPDVCVMSDEIYDHMVYDGEKHVCLLSYPSIRDRLILLNGWSKTYAMTGWRLGYGVFPPKLYEYVRKLAVNLHSCFGAIRRACGADRPAGRGGQDGRRVRQAAQSRGRGAEQVAWRFMRRAQRGVLRLPQRQAHRLEGQGTRQRAPQRHRRRHHRRTRLRHPRRRLYAAVLCQFDREHPQGARPYGPLPGQPEGGMMPAQTIVRTLAAAGLIAFAAPATAQTYLHYTCSNGLEFEATLFPDTKAAFLQVDGKSLNLPKRMSLTWARYSRNGVTFRVKGERATLKRGGKTLDCKSN
jgi:aspartate/methionine/tyrosine aminotransferase/membrane-bound inhibitor of C-type lysozyme